MARIMKDSGVEWLGLIPETWKMVRAKNVFSNHKNIVGDKELEYERLSLTLNGVLKRPKDDSKGLQSESFSTYQILNEKELVFKMIDLANVNTSRVGYSPYTGIVSPVYIIFNNEKHTRYGYYYFYNMWQRAIFNQLGNNGVRSALNASDMLNLPFPQISEEESLKIADFLDEKIGEINAIIAKTKESIEEYKRYKNAVITETVTQGLNKSTAYKSTNIEYIEKIPEHWDILRLRFLGSCQKGIITSNYIINGVTGQILKSDGKTIIYSKTVNPKAKKYSLYNSAIDKALLFNKLAKGTYYYKITATDATGKTLDLINKKFEVKGLSDSQLRTQIRNTHATAKKLTGRKSFNGWCGTYVYWELRARGIFTGKTSSYEKAVNGNKWYSMLSAKKYNKSTGGYTVTKYSGSDCLDKLSNNGKKNVYNIVVSYQAQYGYSAKKPGAGHVVYIHAIQNGKVYLSESYEYGGVKEGNPLVIKYSTFKSKWNKMYKYPLGAVVFTK